MRSKIFINNGREYIIYEDGRVYSKNSDKFLKPSLSATTGYLVYGRLGSMHRLLVEHFINEIPEGMVVNHLDGNKLNNQLSNLEITTHSENVKHAFNNGLTKPNKGEDNGMAKLSNQEALELVNDLKNGYTNTEIGNKYNLHPRYVSLIRHGKRWSNLYKEYGPFNKSNQDPFPEYTKKHEQYIELKDLLNNKEIADILNVDPSTVSRWRSGEFRSSK